MIEEDRNLKFYEVDRIYREMCAEVLAPEYFIPRGFGIPS
jgi:hypothetical protein